jgi:hypothetical protein
VRWLLLALALVACRRAPPEHVDAALGTGSIIGRVEWQGPVPPMVAEPSTRDACLASRFTVNVGSGVAGVMVRLPLGAVRPFRTSHRGWMSQLGCNFAGLMVGVVRGLGMELHNHDEVAHELVGRLGGKTVFDVTLAGARNPATQVADVGPALAELPPGSDIAVTCQIHPGRETAHIVVWDHPLFDVTSIDGEFRIEDVPAGRYQLEAYHAALGTQRRPVEVEPGRETHVTFSWSAAALAH